MPRITCQWASGINHPSAATKTSSSASSLSVVTDKSPSSLTCMLAAQSIPRPSAIHCRLVVLRTIWIGAFSLSMIWCRSVSRQEGVPIFCHTLFVKLQPSIGTLKLKARWLFILIVTTALRGRQGSSDLRPCHRTGLLSWSLRLILKWKPSRRMTAPQRFVYLSPAT